MQADHDSYQALALRRPEVPEVAGSLDVDRAEREADPLRNLTEVDLDLAEAYRLAALASREYRNRREDAYLAALAYTGERHKFESQFALGLITGLQREPGVTTATATPTGSASRAFEAGGSLALKLATDFLQTFGNDPIGTARDLFTADLLIPIGRGAGTLVARENLTQAERDVVYALRTFARYQQELAVSVTSGFYRVLESRDTLENEEASYKSLELVHERAKMFGAGGAGRQPDFAVDQARQNVLLADERRTRARLDFEQALDDYKRELGIPTRVRMTVHEGALEALRQRGLVAPDIDLPHAVDAGLARRLDLANARDQADDAVRKAAVAQDALGAGVDLRLGASLLGAPDRPIDVRGATASGSVGLGFDLPIERTAERNAWRAAQIQADRAQRSLEGLEDQVTADVRTAWRTILAAEKSFTIQQEGVRVAERRVESAKLQPAGGQGRDPRRPRRGACAAGGEERPDRRARQPRRGPPRPRPRLRPARPRGPPARRGDRHGARRGRAVRVGEGRREPDGPAAGGLSRGDAAASDASDASRHGGARVGARAHGARGARGDPRGARGPRAGPPGEVARSTPGAAAPGTPSGEARARGYIRRRMSSSSNRRRKGPWLLVLTLVLLVGGVAAWLTWKDAGQGASTVPTWKVTRGPLRITVTEGGSLQSLKSTTIASEVEGETKIVSIVPEGSVVTPEDVTAGRILVELDASSLGEKQRRQVITVSDAQSGVTQAQEALKIQENQNESDLRKADLDVKFARIDLQRYLGAKLADRVEVGEPGDAPAPDLKRLAVDPLLEGAGLQERRKRESDIDLAREEVARARDKLKWTDALLAKGFVSADEQVADRLALKRQEVALDQAETALGLFTTYEFPKETAKLSSDLREAKEAFLRVKRQGESSLSKSRADLKGKEEKLALETSELQRIERQIASCVIRAKNPGLVVYASSEDRGYYNEGSPIQQGATIRERQPILSIPDPQALGVRINIHESALGKVKPDQTASVVVDAFADKPLAGHVIRMSTMPSASNRWQNPDLKVYPTDIGVDAPPADLRPGLSAKVEILVAEIASTLYVPLQSVGDVQRQGRGVGAHARRRRRAPRDARPVERPLHAGARGPRGGRRRAAGAAEGAAARGRPAEAGRAGRREGGEGAQRPKRRGGSRRRRHAGRRCSRRRHAVREAGRGPDARSGAGGPQERDARGPARRRRSRCGAGRPAAQVVGLVAPRGHARRRARGRVAHLPPGRRGRRRARRRRPPPRRGRLRRDHGPLGLGQVDAVERPRLPRPAHPRHVPPRRRRGRGPARRRALARARPAAGLRVPELQPHPAAERAREHRGPDVLRGRPRGEGARAGARPRRAHGPLEPRAPPPDAALGRPAAARRDREEPRERPARAARRRADRQPRQQDRRRDPRPPRRAARRRARRSSS